MFWADYLTKENLQEILSRVFDKQNVENNPAVIYLLKVNIETLEQGVKYAQS